MKKIIVLIVIFSQFSFAMTQSNKEKVMQLMYNGCINNNTRSYCNCQYNYFKYNVPLRDFESVVKGMVVISRNSSLAKEAPKKTLWYLNELFLKCSN